MIDAAHLEETLFKYSPIFRSLANAERDEAATFFERREVPAETLLTRQGQPSDGLYVLLSGEVRVEARREGGDDVTITHLVDGDFLGEISLFTGRAANASCTTTCDCVLYVLPRERFQDLMVRFPRLHTVAAQAALERTAETSSLMRNDD